MTPALTPAEVYFNLLTWLLIIPIVFGIFLKMPKLIVLGFMGVLFMFSDSTWGELQTTRPIYGRGTGIFYFSILNLILLISGIAALMKRLANPQMPYLAAPISKYFSAFIFLLVSHIIIGLMVGIDLNVILGYNGIINILNMLIFMYLVIIAFDQKNDCKNLLSFLIILASLRSIFGAVRFVMFGGDTTNPYRNFDRIDIKIYFFDIGDNFIATLGAFCIAWLLLSPEVKLSLVKRGFLFLLLLLEVASVALSFRRSALLGLGLAFIFLAFRLPRKKKFLIVLLMTAILSAIAVIFFEQRLQHTGTAGILSSLIFDIAPRPGGIKENRFYELYAAGQSMAGNWLFGLGTWGTFTGDKELLSYHGNDFSFVHSGFGHVFLKTGLVGLVLFCSMLIAYVSFYFKHHKYLRGNAKLTADTGFAGFLFWLPTLLIGTPIIEFRTMLLFGLALAMPFVAIGLGKRHQVHHHIYSRNYAVA